MLNNAQFLHIRFRCDSLEFELRDYDRGRMATLTLAYRTLEKFRDSPREIREDVLCAILDALQKEIEKI